MKSKIIYLFWAVILFLLGIAILLKVLDYDQLSTRDWFLVETGVAVAFVISYFIAGTDKWGWLLPAFIFAGMAADLSSELYHTLLSQPNGVPILIGIALWFLLGFLINRKRWWLLIPAYILVIAAIETAINTMFPPWALFGDIPIFLRVYSSGAGIILLLAFPFFVVYFTSPRNWWSLIPAGILTSFAVMNVIVAVIPNNMSAGIPGPENVNWGEYGWILFFGFALTFGILWLRRKNQPTMWTGYPALGFMILSFLALVLGEHFRELWLASIMLVSAGILLLVSFSQKSATTVQGTPAINP